MNYILLKIPAENTYIAISKDRHAVTSYTPGGGGTHIYVQYRYVPR